MKSQTNNSRVGDDLPDLDIDISKKYVVKFNHERIHANQGVKSTSHYHDNIMMLQ